jgi:hypothetical protein
VGRLRHDEAVRLVDERDTVQLCTRVPRVLWKEVKMHCVERGKKVGEFLADAIREKLDELPRESPQ